jgi:hypothetical protein
MPLEGERHAVHDPQRAENAPPGQQPYLPGAKQRVGRVPDPIIVKNEAMEHAAILPRGSSRTSVAA